MKSIHLNYVIPECYVDTNLIEYLLDAPVNHQHCCSKVVGTMKTKYKDVFAIGIIDKDKVELGYISECTKIAQSKHITLLKHNECHQYLITIYPAIDKFTLDCAKEQGIDIEKYGIPNDLKGFTKIAKSTTSAKDARFKSIFKAIKDHTEIKSLESVLKYLCNNQYNSDIKILKTLL